MTDIRNSLAILRNKAKCIQSTFRRAKWLRTVEQLKERSATYIDAPFTGGVRFRAQYDCEGKLEAVQAASGHWYQSMSRGGIASFVPHPLRLMGAYSLASTRPPRAPPC